MVIQENGDGYTRISDSGLGEDTEAPPQLASDSGSDRSSIASSIRVDPNVTVESNEEEHSQDEVPVLVDQTRFERLSSLYVKYRLLVHSAGQALALFVFCLIALILLLRVLLPPIDPHDKDAVKIPRSFDDLKRLNEVLQIYKERNFGRVLGSFIALYFFLQAYSLPGSMYLSILSGAMYGVPFALPLVCFCVATGATLCYLISALLGPALLLANKTWRDRLDLWKERIGKQGGNMFSYLVVLRLSPLPPHWAVNYLLPHLNISIPMFWITSFFGCMPVSFIHVQIGTTLDQMTSPADFHLISWRNFLGLLGVAVGVMVPVALRYAWSKELAEVASDDPAVVSGEVPGYPETPNASPGRRSDVLVLVHSDDESDTQSPRSAPKRHQPLKQKSSWFSLKGRFQKREGAIRI